MRCVRLHDGLHRRLALGIQCLRVAKAREARSGPWEGGPRFANLARPPLRIPPPVHGRQLREGSLESVDLGVDAKGRDGEGAHEVEPNGTAAGLTSCLRLSVVVTSTEGSRVCEELGGAVITPICS